MRFWFTKHFLWWRPNQSHLSVNQKILIQLLHCEDLQLCSVFYLCKLNIPWKNKTFEELIVHKFLTQTVYSLVWKIWTADMVRWLCGRVSCVAAGDVLRGDDDAAGRIRDADGLPAEQLQGAAGAVHGSGVLLLHRHRGGPHTRCESSTPDSPPKCVGGWVAARFIFLIITTSHPSGPRPQCDPSYEESHVNANYIRSETSGSSDGKKWQRDKNRTPVTQI